MADISNPDSGIVAQLAAIAAQIAAIPPGADIPQYVVATNGGSVICNPNTTLLFLDNAGLIALYTATLPQSPVDGQRLTIAAANIVTLLTINGGTVKGLITTLSANGYARYAYSALANAWFRTG